MEPDSVPRGEPVWRFRLDPRELRSLVQRVLVLLEGVPRVLVTFFLRVSVVFVKGGARS